MSRVTGRQAHDLLGLPDNAASWRIEQRNLAETIAWLYGREPDRIGGWTDLRYELGDGFRVDVRYDTVSVGDKRLSMHFSRDEAIDLARALLAAAGAVAR